MFEFIILCVIALAVGYRATLCLTQGRTEAGDRRSYSTR
jgi:hypothetical protein